ncbi:MAG: SPASM domain-containing protein, partial [Muribaculaceae bacterium]|nr:SPASM domain-containing protein [Muribaculaceae bacterium]
FKTIVSNIEQLLCHKISVTLRINVTPENVSDCSDILDWIQTLSADNKKYLSVNVQQVWQTSSMADISDEVDKLLDSVCHLGVYAYPAIMDNLRSMCYADKANTLVVNSDGNIFKCTAIDFEKEKSESNIFFKDYKKQLNERFDERLKKRFANKSCIDCRIFPLCLGGCHKSVVSHGDIDYCVFGDSQEKKDNLIMTIIKDRIRRDMFSNP